MYIVRRWLLDNVLLASAALFNQPLTFCHVFGLRATNELNIRVRFVLSIK